MNILSEITTLLQKGKATEIAAATKTALEEGISAETVLSDALMPGMAIIGEKFKENKIYVPEMLIAARAMKASIEVLKPHMIEAKVNTIGTVILGTVKGDLHDIGKNLVKIMMEGKGLRVIDLGTDVQAEEFVRRAVEEGSSLISCSALLTTTMTEMGKVVQAVREAGLKDSLSVMVGGAPVTDSFRESIGADYYSDNATGAADLAIQHFSRE